MNNAVTVTPLVSIVVISKDDPTGLCRTLASIAEQRFADLEIVVVVKGDSGSVDACERSHQPYQWLVQWSAGISNAFNEGIAAARGRWINFLNGGDAYRHASVLSELEGVLRRTDALLVTGRARDSRTGVMIPRDHSFRNHNVELVSHQASFFDRSLFERYGLYDRAFSIRMDLEWMLRLPQDIPSIWHDEVLVAFEGQGISSTRPWCSCMEELHALRIHRRSFSRMVRLLVLYFPFRLARSHWRRLWQ